MITVFSYLFFENLISVDYRQKDEQSVQLETIAFTALIFLEYFLCLSELNKWIPAQFYAVLGSLVLYVLILAVPWLQRLFEINRILYWKDMGLTFAIVLISWVPVWLFQLVRRRVSPSDYEKVMRLCKEGRYSFGSRIRDVFSQ